MNVRVRRPALLLVLPVLASVSVACSSSSAPSYTGKMTRMVSPTGQHELLLEPAGPAKGLVLFMHGIDSDQDQLITSSNLYPVRDALLAAGYAIATSDAHGNNTGNPASVQDQLDLLADVRARLPGLTDVDILGFSMGGLDALLSAASHQITGLRSLALLSPACDTATFLSGSFRGAINAAFGFPGSANLAGVVAKSNPYVRPASAYVGYAYHFWQSPDDKVVPATQSAMMVAHLATVGISAPITALTGNHGDLAKLRPADVVALFDRGGSTSAAP